jgi:hypothetical protein
VPSTSNDGWSPGADVVAVATIKTASVWIVHIAYLPFSATVVLTRGSFTTFLPAVHEDRLRAFAGSTATLASLNDEAVVTFG